MASVKGSAAQPLAWILLGIGSVVAYAAFKGFGIRSTFSGLFSGKPPQKAAETGTGPAAEVGGPAAEQPSNPGKAAETAGTIPYTSGPVFTQVKP